MKINILKLVFLTFLFTIIVADTCQDNCLECNPDNNLCKKCN